MRVSYSADYGHGAYTGSGGPGSTGTLDVCHGASRVGQQAIFRMRNTPYGEFDIVVTVEFTGTDGEFVVVDGTLPAPGSATGSQAFSLTPLVQTMILKHVGNISVTLNAIDHEPE